MKLSEWIPWFKDGYCLIHGVSSPPNRRARDDNYMKYIMHVDMNSFFASCEQQANCLLRGRPVGVVAYNAPNSVILAASIEAKRLGIKTGTIAREAKLLCPNIILLENDPPKYRAISEAISAILNQYSDRVEPYSIDESFMDLTGWVKSYDEAKNKALEIKQRLKAEVGDWLSCSIGISFTKFLAKVGSDLKKPDGLTIITPADLPAIYKNVKLTDLWGVANGWRERLRGINIHTIWELYNYPLQNLISLFGKPGHTLYSHIHGFAIENVASIEPLPKSISHQYAIPKAENTAANLPKIIMKLCEKVGRRLRGHELLAQTIFLHVRFYQQPGTAVQKHLPYALHSTADIYHYATELMRQLPAGKIHVLGIGVANFTTHNDQLSLWSEQPKNKTNNIDKVMDSIKDKYGEFAIVHGTMVGGEKFVPDRIGFGK